MDILILIAKIFATLVLIGTALGGVVYIYFAFKKPTYGTVVQTISGAIVFGLSLYGFYYLWFV